MTSTRPRRSLTIATAIALVVAATVVGDSEVSVAQFGDTGRVQTTLQATPPVALQFAGIDAGAGYSVGWTQAGEVFTWGNNAGGQLGNGVQGGSRLVPEQVILPEGTQIVEAVAGINTVIARTDDGGVFTWGNPAIIDTTPTPTRSAFFDALGDPVVGVSTGGFYYLAWTQSGALYSWGDGGSGRLGRLPTSGQSAPARVTAQGLNLRSVDGASAGRFHGVAWVDDGSAAIAWGSGYGTAGGVTLTGLAFPLVGAAAGTDVTLLWSQGGSLFSATSATASAVAGVADVAGADASFPAAGASSLYAWQFDGSLYAWGNNDQGQLGLGSTGGTVASPTLVPLADGSTALMVGAGADHALYLGQDGAYSSAGSNAFGQLGTDDTTQRDTFGSSVPILRWPE